MAEATSPAVKGTCLAAAAVMAAAYASIPSSALLIIKYRAPCLEGCSGIALWSASAQERESEGRSSRAVSMRE
eukprot:scaffold208554_cov35-Tisochrysis_lutea.AAC.2